MGIKHTDTIRGYSELTFIKFVINSIQALFVHIVLVVLGTIVLSIEWMLNFIANSYDPYFIMQTIPLLTIIQIVLSVLICFFYGRMLIVFGKHWLNYLSVCFVSLLLLFSLHHGPDYLFGYVFILNEMYFFGLNRLFHHDYWSIVRNVNVILPSLLIWTGMSYKLRNKKI